MSLDQKTRELGHVVYEAATDVKGQEIRALDLTNVESYTDLVFIISGSSTRQVQAIADRVIENLAEQKKRKPLGTEGFDTAEWILIDYGELVVHVFLDEVRPDYKLEEMWPNINSVDAEEIPGFLKKKPAKAKVN